MIRGTVKSITDFGIFIGLPGGIDGLVHLSDISWNEVGEEAVRDYRKGDEVEAVVLSVDAERERISLGIKQLQNDPFIQYVTAHQKGTIVNGKIREVSAKAAIITLADEVEGVLRASEISRDRVEDASAVLSVGQDMEAKIVNVDRKGRVISLSVKAKDEEDEKEAMAELRSQRESSVGSPATLGDLIKAQMENK